MKHLLKTTLILSCLSLPVLAQSHAFNDGFFADTPARHNTFIADPLKNKYKPRLLANEAAYISKAQAIKIARQHTDGKILSANLIHREQRAFYKIKVLTDQGRIKTLRINAQKHR